MGAPSPPPPSPSPLLLLLLFLLAGAQEWTWKEWEVSVIGMYDMKFKNNKNIKSIDELSGLENVKEFINNYQTLLNNPEAMKEHKIQEFSSMLFWGVPGTGKTSAAMGIAKKLDADYVQIDKEFFDSMFVSEAQKTCRDV